LGFKVEDLSGNVYRWAHFGATTTQGKLVSQDIDESGVVDTDNAIIAPASAVTTTDGTIGSKFIELTLASITVQDNFAGGKIVITDDTGEGYTYGIVSSTKTDDPATNHIRIELDRRLQVAVTSDSDFAIVGNPYGNLEPATSTDFAVVGVSMGSQAAADYGWVLTKGTVGILSSGNIGQIGKGIIVGTAAGSCALATATNDNVFGYCVAAPDVDGYGIFKINCE
jgi:hypothetical protein